MNFLTIAKDKFSHLWVSEPGLMSEMDASFQHLTHRYSGHIPTPVKG